MLALLLKPLMALAYSLGAVFLSWLWYSGLGWVAVGVVAVVVFVGWALQLAGIKKLPQDPIGAVKLFNLRPMLIGAITASAAALAFIIGIEWAVEGAGQTDIGQVKQTKDAIKEIAQTLTAAVVAYITALTVQAADVDTAVGDYVKQQFSRFYHVASLPDETQTLHGVPVTASGAPNASAESNANGSPKNVDESERVITEYERRLRQPPKWLTDGTVEFQPDSLGAYAMSETSIMGLTDWSAKNRMKRAEKIKENLSVGNLPEDRGGDVTESH